MTASFMFGLIIGSFLNVVVYRLPRHESLAYPGSHCPSCNQPIRWYHNIPLIGWLVLKGHCHDCGASIPGRYPMVEALTGACFLAAYLFEGPSPYLLPMWAFLSALIVIAFIDIDHLIIPNKIVLPGTALALAVSLAMNPARWWEYLLAGGGAAVFLLVLGLVWSGGMGFGDVKMALMMGAFLGRQVIVALFLAFLLGGIVGLALIASKRKGRKDRIPFGPYLAAGSAAALLAGPVLIDSYLSLYQ